MKRRPVLIALMLVIALGALIAAFASATVRNSPLQLGDNSAPSETTPEVTTAADTLAAPPSRLAFSGNPLGNWDIFTLGTDGTLVNLTDDASDYQDYFPSVALDGTTINFISNRGTDIMGPSQVKVDGSGLRSLSIVQAVITLFGEGRLDWDPSWSPDGKRLLWSSLRDLNLELYSIPTDAEFTMSNATRLTTTAGREWFGAWSPDGSQIMFQSDREGKENLYIMAVDDSGNVRALTNSPWDDVHGMWSLDGQQVAFLYDENDAHFIVGDMNMQIINVDGSAMRPLDGTFIGDPVTSPDGKSIVYVSNESGKWQIYVMNTDGSNVRRVTPNDADYLFPVWLP